MKQKIHLLVAISLLTVTFSFGQASKRQLANGEKLYAGYTLHSQNKECTLSFQDDVLVISKNNIVIWKSDMSGSWVAKGKIDGLQFINGEIKCFFKNKLQWTSKTNFQNARLILGNDAIIKIESKENKILWESFAVTARSQIPPLVSGGDEGPFTDSMIPPSNHINLYVTFVDWPDAKAETTNWDSLWNLVTSNGKIISSLEEQGQAIGFKVDVHLNKQWHTLPQPISFYFPPATEDHVWNWQQYTKDCPALLAKAFGLDTFSSNSIAVFIANPAAGEKWKKGVPHGNLPIQYKGLRYMISLTPNIFERKYTVLMHEIGHCYGSGELYPVEASGAEDDEMGGLDAMSYSDVATAFMGYHRYRYGWMPFAKDTPRSIYITNPHSYGVVLTPVSAKAGISMILIPDRNSKDLNTPDKLWGIEIGQAMQSAEQFFAGKGEKFFSEGDYILIYSVDAVEQPGKRAIRAISKTGRPRRPDERWRNVYLYREGETFKNPNAPMEVKIYKNEHGVFYLHITLKSRN